MVWKKMCQHSGSCFPLLETTPDSVLHIDIPAEELGR